jgi:hypothetical protein
LSWSGHISNATHTAPENAEIHAQICESYSERNAGHLLTKPQDGLQWAICRKRTQGTQRNRGLFAIFEIFCG